MVRAAPRLERAPAGRGPGPGAPRTGGPAGEAPAGGAGGLAALVLALVFLWLDLLVLDAWAEGTTIRRGPGAPEALDLTRSLVWGGYAVALLLLGSSRGLPALRWTSLALALVTAVKVFLFDLGDLEGLYRVASTAGLALSLIAISVLYHRMGSRRGAVE